MKNLITALMLCIWMASTPCSADALNRVFRAQVSTMPSMRIRESAPISHWFFNSTVINAKGDIVEPAPMEPIHYLGEKELSPAAQVQLILLHPGLTRAAVKKTWAETGGFAPCQFLLLEKGGGPEFVAVRIEWRPAAMPEQVFQDRTLRARWIKRHAPLDAPDDVAMHISRPYLAKYVID